MNLRYDALPAEWQDELTIVPDACDECNEPGPCALYHEVVDWDGATETITACLDRAACFARTEQQVQARTETPHAVQLPGIAA